MIEQIQGYFVFTGCFLLAFLVTVALVESYKERLIRLFRKISWKTTRKFFYIWIGILVLEKLLYYVPFNGIIQIPSSVWWVDKEVLKPMYTLFIAFLLATIGMEFAIKYRGKSSKWRDFCFEMAFMCLTISVIVFTVMVLTSNSLTSIHIIFSPLLVLKMFCSGKYLGLFVSLGLVYFFLFWYRKLIAEIINRCAAKFLVGAFLIIIGFGVFFYYQISGNWEKRFQHKVQAAKSEKAFEDLLDSVQSIKDNIYKSNALRIIALAIAESGDTPLAKLAASSIPNEKIRNITFKKIREKIEKK